MKGDFKMKKSSFITLIMGTVSGVLFALGMCMALLPEWDAFMEGVIFGGVGLVFGVITLLVWCKMENKKMPKMSVKNVIRILYTIIAILVLGVGMCMCLVWEQIVWGTLVGLLGIIMLIALIKFMSPDFASNFTTVAGIGATTVAIVMFVASYFIGRAVLDIKV